MEASNPAVTLFKRTKGVRPTVSTMLLKMRDIMRILDQVIQFESYRTEIAAKRHGAQAQFTSLKREIFWALGLASGPGRKQDTRRR